MPVVKANIQFFSARHRRSITRRIQDTVKKIHHMKNTKYLVLSYKSVDMEHIRLVIITYAPLSNAGNLRNQHGRFRHNDSIRKGRCQLNPLRIYSLHFGGQDTRVRVGF